MKIANPRNSTSPNAKAFQERDAGHDDGYDFFTLHEVNKQDSIDRKDQVNSGSNSMTKNAARPQLKFKPGALSSAQKQGQSVYGHGAQMTGDLAKEDYVTANSHSYSDFQRQSLSNK